MSKTYDSAALGSDIARSRKQYLARRVALAVVGLLRLNKPGLLTTEIVQAINPVATVETAQGPLLCKAGHGRLLWRARTFFTEEPHTVAWLDRLKPDDVYWDIGANVGLYAIYAAKFRRCKTIAFEPESQNYALLVENIVLNGVSGACLPAIIAVSDATSVSRLRVRYITKGGAFNMFEGVSGAGGDAEPASFQAAQSYEKHRGFEQLLFGASVDELVHKHGLPAPTHIKLDVDGIEPKIIEGAMETIRSGSVRSILVELNTKSSADMAVPGILAKHGFQQTLASDTWDQREDRTRAQDLPTVNAVFERMT
jgi:FkbM family methyltransferase